MSDRETAMGYSTPCGDGMHNRRVPGADLCVCEEVAAVAAQGVTRVEVIDHRTASGETLRGRRFVAIDENMSVELQYQDDGRTLKVFLDDAARNGSPHATQGGADG